MIKKSTKPFEVLRVRIADLRPHPRNPRKHPRPGSPAWRALAKSLQADYFDPLVWNARSGLLISGHLRVRVLASLGYTAVDVVSVTLSDREHVSRMLAANKLAGRNDRGALGILITELQEDHGIDLELMGITQAEVDKLLGAELETAPDKTAWNYTAEVSFETESAQIKFARKMSAAGRDYEFMTI